MYDIISKRYGTWGQFKTNTLEGGTELTESIIKAVHSNLNLTHVERYTKAVERLPQYVEKEVLDTLTDLFIHEQLKGDLFLVSDASHYKVTLIVKWDRIILTIESPYGYDEADKEHQDLQAIRDELNSNPSMTTLDKVLTVHKLFSRVPILVAKGVEGEELLFG